jgi:hypothetical protein
VTPGRLRALPITLALVIAGATVVALVLALVVALPPGVAQAQEVGTAAEDLRDNDVTFEDGALTRRELDDLDATASRLQGTDGYFKVVVLAEPVEDFSGADAYATEVRSRLGGRGRVMVVTPDEVAVASNADPADETRRAEQVAADKLNSGGSLAVAASNAAGALGIAGGSTTGSGGDDGGGGGFPWGLVLLFLVPLALLVGFLWWSARRQRERAAAISAASLGEGEAKVREAVDKVANGLLELSDQVDRPDTAEEARHAFSQGAELFTTTQEELEKADTPAELEAVYPKVVEAGWYIDTTRALLAGQPAPPRPEPGELFPRPQYPVGVPAGGDVAGAGDAAGGAGAGAGQVLHPAPAPRPDTHYRRPDLSPWLTAAAMAAMTMLSNRGMSVPRTRPAMNDDMFGSWVGGLPGGPSSNGRSRSRSRGTTVRRPSSSRRGMGRR